MSEDDLFIELRGTRTDLVRFVEVASRTPLPHIVVPPGALRAWAERAPVAWTRVCDWLSARSKTFVELEAGSHPTAEAGASPAVDQGRVKPRQAEEGHA